MTMPTSLANNFGNFMIPLTSGMRIIKVEGISHSLSRVRPPRIFYPSF